MHRNNIIGRISLGCSLFCGLISRAVDANHKRAESTVTYVCSPNSSMQTERKYLLLA